MSDEDLVTLRCSFRVTRGPRRQVLVRTLESSFNVPASGASAQCLDEWSEVVAPALLRFLARVAENETFKSEIAMAIRHLMDGGG